MASNGVIAMLPCIPIESSAKATMLCRVDRFEEKRLLLSRSQPFKVLTCWPDLSGVWTFLIKVELREAYFFSQTKMLDVEGPARQPRTEDVALAAYLVQTRSL